MKKIIIGVLLGISIVVNSGHASEKKGTYELVMNYYNRPVCEEFLQNLKEFEHEDFMSCKVKLSSKYPEFEQLKWVELDIKDPKTKELMEYIWSFVYGESNGYKKIMKKFETGVFRIKKATINGIHKGKKSVLLWIKSKECLEYSMGMSLNKLYLLDEEGEKLDMNAYPFSPREKGGGLWNQGNPIKYKGATKIIVAEQGKNVYDPGYDINFPADGVIMLRYLDSTNNPYFIVGAVKECLYSWTKNK